MVWQLSLPWAMWFCWTNTQSWFSRLRSLKPSLGGSSSEIRNWSTEVTWNSIYSAQPVSRTFIISWIRQATIETPALDIDFHAKIAILQRLHPKKLKDILLVLIDVLLSQLATALITSSDPGKVVEAAARKASSAKNFSKFFILGGKRIYSRTSLIWMSAMLILANSLPARSGLGNIMKVIIYVIVSALKSGHLTRVGKEETAFK